MPNTPLLAVIGSSNLDLIMRVPHLPAEGETILGGTVARAFGGKGANQAVAAARAGSQVAFVTALGEDADSSAMQEAFSHDDIDLRYLHLTDEENCGTAFITLDDKGANTITVATGANGTLLPSTIEKFLSDLDRFKIVLLQLEIPMETAQRVLQEAREKKVTTVLNAAPAHDEATELLPWVDILIVNETEAGLLTKQQVGNRKEAEAAIAILLSKGIATVLITLGGDGVLIGQQGTESVTHLPAFEVRPVDTTGAGDTFCGAFATALMEGQPIREAARFASAAGGLATTKLGAQPSIPNREEIRKLLQ